MTTEQWIVEIVTIAIQSLFIYFTVKEAKKKNRPVEKWAVLGFLFGLIAFGFCYFMKPIEVDNE